MKQTATNYLIEQLSLKTMAEHMPWVAKILDTAIEMEHEQIEFFYKQGHLNSGCPYALEEVYHKTFPYVIENRDTQS
jgi:hypothetical protein